MLEVLDPEQNVTFMDHYLDIPFNLSRIMFIATANDVSTLPGPLLDRMELIDFTGYTEKEKCRIARDLIIPRQLKAAGLHNLGVDFSTEAISTDADREIFPSSTMACDALMIIMISTSCILWASIGRNRFSGTSTKILIAEGTWLLTSCTERLTTLSRLAGGRNIIQWIIQLVGDIFGSLFKIANTTKSRSLPENALLPGTP